MLFFLEEIAFCFCVASVLGSPFLCCQRAGVTLFVLPACWGHPFCKLHAVQSVMPSQLAVPLCIHGCILDGGY